MIVRNELKPGTALDSFCGESESALSSLIITMFILIVLPSMSALPTLKGSQAKQSHSKRYSLAVFTLAGWASRSIWGSRSESCWLWLRRVWLAAMAALIEIGINHSGAVNADNQGHKL